MARGRRNPNQLKRLGANSLSLSLFSSSVSFLFFVVLRPTGFAPVEHISSSSAVTTTATVPAPTMPRPSLVAYRHHLIWLYVTEIKEVIYGEDAVFFFPTASSPFSGEVGAFRFGEGGNVEEDVEEKRTRNEFMVAQFTHIAASN